MSRPGRPRISTGIHESKTLALYNAGCALLATSDYEAFSVAEIARRASCSVGAFYVRFPDKNDFLSFVIRHSFDFAAHAFADALTNGGVKAIGGQSKVRLAVLLLSEQFADSEFAGALCAAVKLGFSEPMYRVPLDRYREAVTDHLVQWLAADRSKHELQVRSALQIVLGALTDAALSESGAQFLRSGAFQNALVFMLENAASGAIKSGAEIEPQKSSKSLAGTTLPVSALKKASGPATKTAHKKPASKQPPRTSLPAFPPRRIRKV
jgi:AcrR family transcriptional regulator